MAYGKRIVSKRTVRLPTCRSDLGRILMNALCVHQVAGPLVVATLTFFLISGLIRHSDHLEQHFGEHFVHPEELRLFIIPSNGVNHLMQLEIAIDSHQAAHVVNQPADN